MRIDQMQQLQANEMEYDRLTNRFFLLIMFWGCTVFPLILIIIQLIHPIFPIIVIVFAIIVLPSGIIFSGNGFRLLYGNKIKLALNLAYVTWKKRKNN